MRMYDINYYIGGMILGADSASSWPAEGEYVLLGEGTYLVIAVLVDDRHNCVTIRLQKVP